MLEHVVRVPLQRSADDDEDFILIHVKAIELDALDLVLTSTDNRAIFSATMTHDWIAKPQADQKADDRSQWEAVLRWVLLRQAPERRYSHVIETLDLQAVVENNRKITVTIRQSISGIIQRLGSLEFRYSPEVEADMFQWAGTQADNALQLTKEKIQMLGREASHQLTIDRLKAQMDEFMKKQRKREDDMLEQFRQLLNTKKLKIRDQQRLLAGAKVDPRAAKAIKEARGDTSKPHPQTSRKRTGTGTTDGNNNDPDIKDERTTDAETDDEVIPQLSDQSDEEGAAFEAPMPTREMQSIPDKTSASPEATTLKSASPPPARRRPAQIESVNGHNSAQDNQMNGIAHDDDDDDETDDEL